MQTYFEKISGTRMAIASALEETVHLRIYVGRSAFTEEQEIDDKGLDDGAFRMKSGNNWFVLLGRDDDFVLNETYSVTGGATWNPLHEIAGRR